MEHCIGEFANLQRRRSDVANSKFDVGTSGAPDTLWARLLQDNGTLTVWQQYEVPCPLPRRIERVLLSIASPLTRPSPEGSS
jgi:hypothetical protein